MKSTSGVPQAAQYCVFVITSSSAHVYTAQTPEPSREEINNPTFTYPKPRLSRRARTSAVNKAGGQKANICSVFLFHTKLIKAILLRVGTQPARFPPSAILSKPREDNSGKLRPLPPS